jgi:putative DNA primase/helicase
MVLTSGTLSIIGGIQPSRLQQYISEAYSFDSADGFPQRFLFAYPDAQRRTEKPTQSDYEELERGLATACDVLKTLAERSFEGRAVSESGDRFFPVAFSQDAQPAFDEWKRETEEEAQRLESEDEVFASFLYKLPKSCAAIVLIFHCLENVNATHFPDKITTETTLRALAYVEVMITHARRVFALGENRMFSVAQSVLGRIKAGKLVNGFTVREVKRKGWAGLQSSEMIQEILSLLADYGYLQKIERGEGLGRPTAKYYVHPTIHSNEVDDEVE